MVPYCLGLLLLFPLRPNQVPHVVSLIFFLEIIFYKFDMKYLKKAEGHTGRNFVSLTMKMNTIVQIFKVIIIIIIIMSDTNCNWCSRYSHQRMSTGTGGLGNKKTSGDHPNNCIVKIDQNTEVSQGHLMGLAVAHAPTKKPSANAGVKNSQESKIIINIYTQGFTPEWWRRQLDVSRKKAKEDSPVGMIALVYEHQVLRSTLKRTKKKDQLKQSVTAIIP